MEIGWIVVIGGLLLLSVVGKCGELYHNNSRHSLQVSAEDNTNLLPYNYIL